MTAVLLQNFSRATDANGEPISGAFFKFYIEGTTTPQAVYGDADMGVSLGAVVEADSAGRFPPIYLDTTKSYRGIVTNAAGTALPDMDIDPISSTGFVSLTGTETISNKTFLGATSFATNGSRIGITSDAVAITPSSLVEIVNEVVTCGLRVSSYWTGTTASPYQNNDNSLWETFNTLSSDSENYSWSISAPNAYNDIPAGLHDSGERVGVYGWATSVNVPGEYEHKGLLTSQIGVRGAAGFQGDANPSPTGARIISAIGVKGEIRSDSPLAQIDTAIAGHFTCIDPGGIIENNIGVYSSVNLGTETNWSFFGAAGELFNEDRAFFGEGSVNARQSPSTVTARGVQPNALEFGNPDPAGFGSNLGSTASSGAPFLAFCAEAEAAGNTFRTRGKKGAVVTTDLAGALIFARVATATATGQSLTEMARFDDSGRLIMANAPTYADNAAAVSGGLVVGTVYKTAAGDLRIVV
jgi:hypothetical protein